MFFSLNIIFHSDFLFLGSLSGDRYIRSNAPAMYALLILAAQSLGRDVFRGTLGSLGSPLTHLGQMPLSHNVDKEEKR